MLLLFHTAIYIGLAININKYIRNLCVPTYVTDPFQNEYSCYFVYFFIIFLFIFLSEI